MPAEENAVWSFSSLLFYVNYERFYSGHGQP
ncbi:hypothetical protein PBAL39_12272 [Pedobacter sp. BAL39]|nr:hypothetical protein PBAL39_12272 [Pedobacter sp. BAL39]